MNLPNYAANCIQVLETAGFQAYCVGGCVRDFLLGLQSQDIDICTNALPEQTQALFEGLPMKLEGFKHGTVTPIVDGQSVEITTYRAEGPYTDHRHPEWVRFVPDVTQDLARRDFTVNAIAWSPSLGWADPFGGREDLQKKILRCVGDPKIRFREDALRILRGMRFAVRFGLTVEGPTWQAMLEAAPLIDNLSRERVFEELSKLLPLLTAEDMARFAPILSAAIPELAPMVGFDQRSPHHAYDLYTHVSYVTQNVTPDVTLRWAALLHDIGKVPTFRTDETGRGHFKGHAPVGAEMADVVLRRLHAPNTLREEAVLLIGLHMARLQPERGMLRRRLAQLGPETLHRLLSLQEADMVSKGTAQLEGRSHYAKVRQLLAVIEAEGWPSRKELSVSGNDLIALGVTGKAIGTTLDALYSRVLDETLPNEKNALLKAAKEEMP